MLVLILIVVLYCVYAIWSRQKRWLDSYSPPILPDALPIIGHAPLFPLDSDEMWQLIQKISYGSLSANGVITLLLGPRNIYVLTDPEDCLTAANMCLDKSDFYDFARPWIGQGLISAEVPTWKYHRKLLNPAFSQHVLDGFIGVFNSQARRLVDSLAVEVGRGQFDHYTYMALNGLETICLTAMGLEINEEDMELNNQYFHALAEMFEILIERMTKVWLHSDHVFRMTRLKKRQDDLIKILHNMSNKVIQKRKNELYDNNNCHDCTDNLGGKFKPFLDLLLKLASDKGVFTDQQIREEIDTMIVAGHDTSATSLMFTLLLLGSHQNVQEKLYNELQEVLEGSDKDLNKHDFSKLVYLDAVIKESLRLYPIFPIVTRRILKDLKLKNYILSAGSECFIMLYGIHRHPMWGPDVEEFKPERWLDPARLPDNPAAFAAFSPGRRGCIGKNFALMSMKTTLTHVLRRYKVSGDHTKLKLKLGVMLKPAAGSGHHIAIERRTQNTRSD